MKSIRLFALFGVAIAAASGLLLATPSSTALDAPGPHRAAEEKVPGPDFQPAAFFANQRAAYQRDLATHPEKQVAASANAEPEYFFTGKPYDADTKSYFFLRRNYRPDTASWMTPDPSGFPDGPNNYAYAGNPLTSCDPLGLTISITGGSPSPATAVTDVIATITPPSNYTIRAMNAEVLALQPAFGGSFNGTELASMAASQGYSTVVRGSTDPSTTIAVSSYFAFAGGQVTGYPGPISGASTTLSINDSSYNILQTYSSSYLGDGWDGFYSTSLYDVPGAIDAYINDGSYFYADDYLTQTSGSTLTIFAEWSWGWNTE